MARINTKLKLTDYIKSQLGAPSIQIEVTDAQISEIIDDTVQKFTEYAYGTLEDKIILELEGMGDYSLPDTITNIIDISKGGTSNLTNFGANFGAGYVPNLWSEQYFSGSLTGSIMPGIIAISSTKAILDKYFADGLSYNFNPYKKIFSAQENFIGPVLVHYQYEYIADEENDLIYNHEWIKNFSKAKVKELWGGVTGKYDQALVGGARVNYSDLKSEAQSSIQELNEELLTKWSDPAPISIG